MSPALPKLAVWTANFAARLDRRKETELLRGFISDVFGGLLGNTGSAPWTQTKRSK